MRVKKALNCFDPIFAIAQSLAKNRRRLRRAPDSASNAGLGVRGPVFCGLLGALRPPAAFRAGIERDGEDANCVERRWAPTRGFAAAIAKN